MAEDIVKRLQAELNDPQGHIVISTTVDADLLRDARDEITRLRDLADQLADAILSASVEEAIEKTDAALAAYQDARREQ